MQLIRNLLEIQNRRYDEPSHQIGISVNDFMDYVTKNCHQYLSNGRMIKRGMGIGVPEDVDCFWLNPPTNRQSANTLNFYTLWFSNNPAFKNLPRRDSSFICGLNFDNDRIMDFGSGYIAFPSDSTKVGIVGTADLWALNIPGTSIDVEDLIGRISDWHGFLMRYLKFLPPYVQKSVPTFEENIETYEQLVSFLKICDVNLLKYVKNIENAQPSHYRGYDEIEALISAPNFKNLQNEYDWWEKYVTPNIFKMTTAGNLSSFDDKTECWFSSKCMWVKFPKKYQWNQDNNVKSDEYFEALKEAGYEAAYRDIWKDI